MVEWPIDPRNPGEVLACAGLAHLAWRADPPAKTGFLRETGAPLRFLAPHDALPGERPALEPLAGPPHERLRLAGIELDWWCPWGLNPNLKNWSGPQSARTVHHSLRSAAGGSRPTGWLTCAAPAAGRIYLDPAGTWNALSLGWSLKQHHTMRMSCRPWVELLASVGLQAFPVPGHRARGGFHYNLWRPGGAAKRHRRVRRTLEPDLRARALPRRHGQVRVQHDPSPGGTDDERLTAIRAAPTTRDRRHVTIDRRAHRPHDGRRDDSVRARAPFADHVKT